MKTLHAALSAVLAALPGPQTAPEGPSGAGEPPPALDSLAWMAGTWSGEHGGVLQEETWLVPRGGLLLGLHRDTRPGGGRAFFEYLRVEERDSGPVYVAQPRGGAATEFALRAIEGQRAVFENPDHDYPQRVIYERVGDELRARIEGEVDGHPRASQWVWRLEPAPGRPRAAGAAGGG